MSNAEDEIGYKFETLSLIPDTWDATSRDLIESREEEVVDNYAQYCSIVKTGMGNVKMVLGGEVDAGTTDPHMRLKTPSNSSQCLVKSPRTKTVPLIG